MLKEARKSVGKSQVFNYWPLSKLVHAVGMLMRPWHRLSRKNVAVPSLEVSEARFDGAWGRGRYWVILRSLPTQILWQKNKASSNPHPRFEIVFIALCWRIFGKIPCEEFLGISAVLLLYPFQGDFWRLCWHLVLAASSARRVSGSKWQTLLPPQWFPFKDLGHLGNKKEPPK